MVFRLFASKKGEVVVERLLSAVFAFFAAIFIYLTALSSLSSLREGHSFELEVAARKMATRLDALSSLSANVLLDSDIYTNGFSFDFQPNSVSVAENPEKYQRKEDRVTYPFVQNNYSIYQLNSFVPTSLTLGGETKYSDVRLKMGKTGNYIFVADESSPVDPDAFSCPPPSSVSLTGKSFFIEQILDKGTLSKPVIQNRIKNSEISVFTYAEHLPSYSVAVYLPADTSAENMRLACLFLNRLGVRFRENGHTLDGRALVPWDFDIIPSPYFMVIAIDPSIYDSSQQAILDAVTEAINLYG